MNADTQDLRLGGRSTTAGDRPLDRRTRLLQVLLALAIVESFIHYLENTIKYADYTAINPSILGSLVKQWVVPISWVLFTWAPMVELPPLL